MDFSQVISQRSVTSFTDKPISTETVKDLIEAAREAPTAFNLQPYSVIHCQSDHANKAVADAIYEGNNWLLDAPCILLLVGDKRIDTHAEKAFNDVVEKGYKTEETASEHRKQVATYSERDDTFITGWLMRNTMIPATYLILACRDNGLGTCPVRGFDRDGIKHELGLASFEKPILLFPIGYPANDERPRKWRRSVNDIYQHM